MFDHLCVRLGVVVFAIVLGGAARAESVASFDAMMRPHNMTFIVAKGDSNTCGADCREWIAAQGYIDPGAAQRFREFLDALPRRNLPVFFHSPGGSVGQAMKIGRFLRENQMAVGVGRTIPGGCSAAIVPDEACRNRMRSKIEHQARFVTQKATCESACVYAFFGGAIRQVAQAARLGVHGQLKLTAPVSKMSAADGVSIRKNYVTEMGVDPSVVDVAVNTSPNDMHYLSRAEIARFSVEALGTRR